MSPHPRPHPPPRKHANRHNSPPPPNVTPPGAMRSHLHYDESKDLWSVELKVPRAMTPLTLGFVLWNAGEAQGVRRREGGRGGGGEGFAGMSVDDFVVE